MTGHRPHGRYPFTITITDPVLEQAIIHDFECEVDIEVDVSTGEPHGSCTEVYVDGKSLKGGSQLTQQIRLEVMQAAEDDFRAGGYLWDQASADCGLVYQGLGGNDPDGRWIHA